MRSTAGRRNAAGAEEEVLLDVNQLGEGQPYMALGSMSVSPDNRLLAYTTDNTGFRQYTLHVRDLSTGKDLSDTAERVTSIAWAADSATLFYVTEDEQTKRSDTLFRHTVGASEADEVVFNEPDERFNVGVGRTRDLALILVECGSHTTSEYRFFSAAEPRAALTLIAPRVDDQEYYPDHRDGLFFLRTNDTTDNFRLVTAPVATPGREHWQEIYRGPEDVPLEDFDLFQTFCVLSERRAGLADAHRFSGDACSHAWGRPAPSCFPSQPIRPPEAATGSSITTQFRYTYTSLVAPPSVYDYDVSSGASALLKQQEVPGGFDASRYASGAPVGEGCATERRYRCRWCIATRSFSWRRHEPVVCVWLWLLRVRAAGGIQPRATVAARPWTGAGVCAHPRWWRAWDPWHDAGKMRSKRNTFTDFTQVVEALVKQGYGDAARVGIEGGSAGGLLMGAVVNMRPELFRAVLSHVPFVDVMNTMLDASLPLDRGRV